jgi:hypothetical protein
MGVPDSLALDAPWWFWPTCLIVTGLLFWALKGRDPDD